MHKKKNKNAQNNIPFDIGDIDRRQHESRDEMPWVRNCCAIVVDVDDAIREQRVDAVASLDVNDKLCIELRDIFKNNTDENTGRINQKYENENTNIQYEFCIK